MQNKANTFHEEATNQFDLVAVEEVGYSLSKRIEGKIQNGAELKVQQKRQIVQIQGLGPEHA